VLDVVESPKYDARLFIGDERRGFRVAEMTSGAIEDLPYQAEYGKPIKIVDTANGTGLIILCYENCGIVAHADTPADEIKRFNWRQTPMTFATKLQPPLSVVNSMGSAEVSASNSSFHSTNSTAVSNKSLAGGTNSTLLVAGSATTVDIWSLDSGRIVHIFETKKDRIKSLEFLFVRNRYRLFMLADEDKDGARCSSIISVYQDWEPSAQQQPSQDGSLKE